MSQAPDYRPFDNRVQHMTDPTVDGSFPAPFQHSYPSIEPGYENYSQSQRDATIALPKMKAPRNVHASRKLGLIVAGLVVFIVLTCGLTAAFVGSGNSGSGNSGYGNGSISTAHGLTPADAGAPTPSASTGHVVKTARFFNMGLGSAVRNTTDSGSIEIEVVKMKIVTTCGQYDAPQTKGDLLLIVYLSADVVSGTGDVNPYDWELSDAAGHNIEQSYQTCDKTAGSGGWPGEDGIRQGKALNGYLVYEISGRSILPAELTYAPDLIDDVASWSIPK